MKKEKEEKVIISAKLNTISPKATKILEDEAASERVKKEIVIPNLTKIFDSLEKGQTPKQLQYFYGGENREFRKKRYQFGLNKDNKNFLIFSWFCRTIKYFEDFICKLFPKNSFFSTSKFFMDK